MLLFLPCLSQSKSISASEISFQSNLPYNHNIARAIHQLAPRDTKAANGYGLGSGRSKEVEIVVLAQIVHCIGSTAFSFLCSFLLNSTAYIP